MIAPRLTLTPIVARLRAAGFAHVEGVLEFAGLRDAPRHSPALFVAPDAEDAAPNRMSGIIDQRVRAVFAVILVIAPDLRRRDGVDDGLAREEARIITALLGWMHPEAAAPAEYAGARLLSAGHEGVARALRFSTAYHLRSTGQ